MRRLEEEEKENIKKKLVESQQKENDKIKRNEI